MIKRLFGLIIIGIGLFNISFGYDYLSKYIDLPGSFLENGYENFVSNTLQFSNNYGNNWLSISDGRNGYYYIFWNNGKLYYYDNGFFSNGGTQNKDNVTQGYFERFCKVENWKLGTGEGESMRPCQSYDMTLAVGSEFYSLSGVDFDIMLTSLQDEGDDPGLCFNNRNNGYIYCTNKWNNGIILTGTLNIGSGVDGFSSFAQSSPFYAGINDYPGSLPDLGISPGSDYSAVNYYEKTYGWNKSICYAGVNSLSYLYGQNGVSFNEGQGLSIFDVFEGIYGNRDLDKVYVWLNTQLFNYENWFDTNGRIGSVGNPSWLGTYNSGTNQMDLYYDNLTFPFANKPVAFYFLANNIESYSPYSTMGSSIVSYCNIKINSGSFVEIIDQSDKNNINNYTEQSNINQGLNSDGTQKDYTGYWVGSGVDLAFSGNVSIKNTLKNFFDEFDRTLGSLDINTNNRILPTWLVTAFIFVVLFKFLRKK